MKTIIWISLIVFVLFLFACEQKEERLRQLAVDLRKNNTNVTKVQSCIKIDDRLREMGVSSDKVEQWLDICQDIASPAVSNDQFVATALELANLETENGLTNRDVITNYSTKLNRSAELDKEIEKKSDRLNEVKLKHEQEKEQTNQSLTLKASVLRSNLPLSVVNPDAICIK